MFKSYLVTAWRNLMHRKIYAIINVFGLALGISACLVMYLFADFEFSYDNFHPDHKKIFRVVSDGFSEGSGERHSSAIPDPAPFAMRRELTGLATTAVFNNYEATVSVAGNRGIMKKFARPKRGEENSSIIIAEPSYFDLFHYEWLTGNSSAFSEPFSVVLTESKAKMYFGNLPLSELLNKEIRYNDSVQVKVAGIVKDPQKNTDFTFTDFISFATVERSDLKKEFAFEDWGNSHTNEQVFVKLNNDANQIQVEKQLTGFVTNHIKQDKGEKIMYRLQPLKELHFDSRYEDRYSRKVQVPTLYGLMGIALAILMIAVINFVTLSTAYSVDRTKETMIRKICGGSAKSLVACSMVETFLLTLLAVLFSVTIIQPTLNFLHAFLPGGVVFPFSSVKIWLFLSGLALLTAVLAGLYPAKLLASTEPVINIKNGGNQKQPGKNYLIKGLIVFQFTVALVFIIGTIVVTTQVKYLQSKELGFNKEAIVNLQTDETIPPAKKVLLAEKLRQLPEIIEVSTSEGTPAAKLHWFNPLTYKGSEKKATASCVLEWGDADFVSLYGIKMIAGRNLLPSDSIREFLINESCVKALGFAKPDDAVGKMVETMTPVGNVSRPIVGVMADFHSESLREIVKPVVLTTSIEFTRLINIKLNPFSNDLTAALQKIEKTWKEVYPNDPFNPSFFDATLAKFYEREQNTASMIDGAMIVSICISCLGLIGMAALTTKRRTKEIGIRKVLGAGVSQIVLLLSSGTLKLVSLSVIIASPIAWFAMHTWLNNFAYHIQFSWWILPVAALVILLVAFFAVGYQSLKAAMVNPVNSLRSG